MKKSPQEKLYKEEVHKQLLEKYDYKNKMVVPKLKKIVISMGLAEATKDKQLLEAAINDLKLISGQKPMVIKSKKSISNFKLREGMTIGAKVTLRGHRMYDFMYRFVHIVSPRIRDFRGFPRKADGRGSYSLGLKDQAVYPEINLDKLKFTQGMNITFVTTANTNNECLTLLELMGMPLKKVN